MLIEMSTNDNGITNFMVEPFLEANDRNGLKSNTFQFNNSSREINFLSGARNALSGPTGPLTYGK